VDDAAVVEHHRAGDQVGQRPDLVQHDQQRGASLDQARDGVGERALAGGVDPGVRLVEHQEVR
jgi:hypothetical protein